MYLIFFILVPALVLALLIRNFPAQVPKLFSKTRPRWSAPWNVWRLSRAKKASTAFYLADDCSPSKAIFEPVYAEKRIETWIVLGEKAGGRSFLDRLIKGLATNTEHVYYITAGVPPAKDRAYSLLADHDWKIWCPDLDLTKVRMEDKHLNELYKQANKYQPQWLDNSIHSNRLWNIIQSWAQSFTSTYQGSRMMSSADLLSYLEVLWPMICKQSSWSNAFREVSYMFDVDSDINLQRFRSYLAKNNRLEGDWSLRLSKILNNRQITESLSLFWNFMRQWADMETGIPIAASKPNKWFCVFPQQFSAGASYTIELLLGSCKKPGLIILDRIGELLPPEIYVEQLQRLKRNNWTIVILEPNLTWTERGDEGETKRFASLADNWLFGRLDGSSANLVERSINIQTAYRRLSITERPGLSFLPSNSTTQQLTYEPIIPAHAISSLPYNQAIVVWKFPPSFEDNQVRCLSIDS
jgi:hypothetical protein